MCNNEIAARIMHLVIEQIFTSPFIHIERLYKELDDAVHREQNSIFHSRMKNKAIFLEFQK